MFVRIPLAKNVNRLTEFGRTACSISGVVRAVPRWGLMDRTRTGAAFTSTRLKLQSYSRTSPGTQSSILPMANRLSRALTSIRSMCK